MADRRRLPTDREAIVHRFCLGGECKGYLVVGLFEDGEPGELFVHISKEGSSLSGWADAFATMFSIALQHGAPLEDLCDKLRGSNFEPQGWVPQQGFVSSLPDYIARWMRTRFLDKGPTNE